ncbi:3-isopropylmalate dehydratase small subunit [Streptomyces sp. FH025]|uniref:3-isopropylmalate dehydratase small subunit n=1 Tax=Streptomyces sp. FH025 TaxID=2815937 RepID=UPI001A9E404A|nr:3-isopropylmalate dehydratase small subunit [Streptomyces sp. FH025]MBO1419204.1 3-isopropylmalate dehydratase small subunit [Streptomyces sp. FH025]
MSTVQPFHQVTGIAAPLLRANIDTDAIAPSRFRPASLSKYGYEAALFAGLRFDEDGAERPDFVLNQPPYRNAVALVVGPNFGCGSSRETAVWALRDFGIRAVIAPTFGSIFETNCLRNGLLPLSLPPAEHQRLADETFAPTASAHLTIDLDTCRVAAADGPQHTFTIDERSRRQLLSGLDTIGETLLLRETITRFRTRDRHRRPWNYPTRSTTPEGPTDG